MRILILLLLLTSCAGDDGSTPAVPQQQTTQAPPPTPQQPTTPPSTPPPASAPPPPTVTPAANVGPDQTVRVGEVATITGMVTPADYAPICWQLLSRPEASQAILAGVTNNPLASILKPDLPGVYVIKLGCGAPLFPELPGEPSDTITITALPVMHMLTLHFAAMFPDGGYGTLEGTFTYETTQGPVEIDWAGAPKGNVRYALADYHFTFTPGGLTISNFPTVETFSPTEPNNTGAFCLGNCIFTAGQTAMLQLENGRYRIRIGFRHADPTPTINPPATLAEWGTHLQSDYRIPCPVCVPLLVINEATLTAVPASGD